MKRVGIIGSGMSAAGLVDLIDRIMFTHSDVDVVPIKEQADLTIHEPVVIHIRDRYKDMEVCKIHPHVPIRIRKSDNQPWKKSWKR